MNLLKILLLASFVFHFSTTFAHAQWVSGLKAGQRGMMTSYQSVGAIRQATNATALADQAAHMARQITRNIVLQKPLLRMPVLTNLEPNIHRFIFTITPRGQQNGFKASGFVFIDNQVLWGASAAHAVRHMGKDVTVTFHLDGSPVSFPATVELTGRKLGLNAALIKLPAEVAHVALPFTLASKAATPQQPVFTYGFSAGVFKKTVRSVLVPGTERLLTDFPRFSAPKPGFCGSVVLNEQGEAIGIETGGYKLNNELWPQQINPSREYKPLNNVSYISEVVPTQKLQALLREYHTTHAGSRMILLNGMKVGPLEVDEYIDRIGVHYTDGTHLILERSPLWELQLLGQAIPNIEQAKEITILIHKNRDSQFIYSINLTTQTVKRESL